MSGGTAFKLDQSRSRDFSIERKRAICCDMINSIRQSTAFTALMTAFWVSLGPSPVVAQDHSRVSLMPGRMMEDGRYLAGIRIELAQGWKTYWRAPGTGGIPPQFDWSGSANLATVETAWPTPTVFETYGLRSIGYDRDVIFPVLLQPEREADQIELRLTLDYGVCADICIPAHAVVSGAFEPNRDMTAPALEAAFADQARDAAAHGIEADCILAPGTDAGAWQLSAQISGHTFANIPAAVVEIPNPDLWVHEPSVEGTNPLTLTTAMDWFGTGAFSTARSNIRITLLPEGERAIDLRGC